MLVVVGVQGCHEYEPGPGGDEAVVPVCPQVRLVDSTGGSGLDVYNKTFGAAVADMDNDGTDDLVISNHGQPPSLYLNKDGRFIDHSHLLPDRFRADRHGVTAVDLDNDGDKDLIIAGGGSDGIGPGQINRLFRNLLCDSGSLAFENVSYQVGITYQAWRGRHFLPLPNPVGSRIDLYLACLSREGCPNLYFSNRSGLNIELAVDEAVGLNQSFHSEGKDLFFDYDRDGDQDLVIISRGRPLLFEQQGHCYVRRDTLLPKISAVYSLGVGDLNNDGWLDLYCGGQARRTGSDRISFNDRELHFVVQKQGSDAVEGIRFYIEGRAIDIDFVQHVPGLTIRDPSNIFIGRRSKNPPSRSASIAARMAEGEPQRQKPGIYIWTDVGSGRWHLEWVYGGEHRQDKGKIMARAIRDVGQYELEILPENETTDRILINENGQGFRELAGLDLGHHHVTRSVAMCDLNNDGLLDIVGIRGSEPGQYNGEPFVLVNCGDLRFEFNTIMANEEDDIFQADQLVCGFFNDDGLPDLFFSNGYGLNPGFTGPYKLFLNHTPSAGHFVILELEGSTANRDALGTEVELFSIEGGLLGYRQLGAGFNRSQSSHKLHFGLGAFNGELTASIRWPGTPTWERRRLTVNTVNHIKQQI